MLYIVFFIFLLMHGPIFYFFFMIPGFAFIVEKLGMALIVRKAKYGQMYIERVNTLPSNVRLLFNLK